MKENNYNSHSVVTNDLIDDEVQVIAVDENGKVEEISLDYNEYRKELILAYKRTIMDNSVVSTFSIVGDECKHVMVVKDGNGEKIIKEKSFKYNDGFIDGFLIPMVDDYSKENLVHDSTIELLGENQSNFVVKTKLNDSLIILGSSVELANKLRDVVSKNNISVNIIGDNKNNQKGVGSFVALGILMVAMLLLISGIVVLFNR